MGFILTLKPERLREVTLEENRIKQYREAASRREGKTKNDSILARFWRQPWRQLIRLI